MNKPRISRRVGWTAACLVTAGLSLQGLTLTGNVENDFVGTQTVIVPDNAVFDNNAAIPLDVGVPSPPFPFPSPASGWDIKDVRFFYDRESDVLYVGINFFGIAGDADADGDPANSSATLTAVGGSDVGNLGPGEAIQVAFDWNEDERFDTIAGVPIDADAAAFSIAVDLSPARPGEMQPANSSWFGTPLAGIEPFVGASGAVAPDFEFKIPQVSTLPGFNAAAGFSFRAFAGSSVDAGIGDDRVGRGLGPLAINTGVHVDLPAPAPEPPVAPTLALTELIVSRSHFNFWGTASGDGLAVVEYKINKRHRAQFERAKGTTSWRFSIRRDGFQSLRVVVRAVNGDGTASPETAVEIQP